VFSAQYRALKAELAERHRSLTETRKRAHGKLATDILKLGTNIITEKLSYKAFQKLYGRSVSKSAPGMFISRLSRKAENAGGKVFDFSTYSTRLSQTCHCGNIMKKPLSQRQHVCECGTKAQRDPYSAFFAKYVFKDILNTRQAAKAWPGANLLLERAVSRVQSARLRYQARTTRTGDRAARPIKTDQQQPRLAAALSLPKRLLILPSEPLALAMGSG